MIVVEDRFEEAINLLPKMKNTAVSDDIEFPVSFSFGDDKELMSYLIENRQPYPLIWLVTPFEEKHYKKRVVLNNVSFILAVETNDKMLNKERFKTTYKNVLIPLYDNFKYLIEKANIFNAEEEISVIKYPFYSNEKKPGNRETLKSSEKNKTFDIWDAIKVTIKCNVNDNCLRPLVFKN